MKVACHYTIPEPPHLELDAAIQDGLRIIDEIDGEINFLYPGKKVHAWFPQVFSGFQQLGKLREIDQRVDVHHVFSNGFYPFPIYNFLRSPIVVSTVISLQDNHPIRFPSFFRNVKQFVVPTVRDQKIMRQWGYDNVNVVVPGIDLTHFSCHPCPDPLQSGFTLLMGSAPWNEKQFVSKGIELLLEVMKELEWLRIVFLWRGLHLEDMKKRVEAAGMKERVSLIAKHVDVNEVLADVHGAVLLAQDMQLIKPYPHSIIESMVAGRPVVVSKCLSVSEFVVKNRCGQVVENFDAPSLKKAIVELRNNHNMYCEAVQKAPVEIFSSSQMVKDLALVYDSVVDEVGLNLVR